MKVPAFSASALAPAGTVFTHYPLSHAAVVLVQAVWGQKVWGKWLGSGAKQTSQLPSRCTTNPRPRHSCCWSQHCLAGGWKSWRAKLLKDTKKTQPWGRAGACCPWWCPAGAGWGWLQMLGCPKSLQLSGAGNACPAFPLQAQQRDED